MIRQILIFLAMQKIQLIIYFILFAIFTANAQYQADSIISLNNPITESSGLLVLNGTFITHNDSGGEAALYEIDTLTGNVSRTVYVGNATNVDWEDITADFTHIYIGDFGNNQGTRQNLRIYKISQADYWANDTVLADTIRFSYANQTNFTPAPFQTNFDAEALITFNDSLYIFTKQWGNPGGTRVYGLPKMAGTFVLPVHDSLGFPAGIVTAADMVHDALVDALVLLISDPNPRLHARYNITSSKFSIGTNSENALILPGSIQAEGLATDGRNRYYFTSEEFLGKPSVLSVLRKNPLFNLDENRKIEVFTIYPNPTTSIVQIESKKAGEVIVYSLDGKQISAQKIDAHVPINLKLPESAGTYVVKLFLEDGSVSQQKIVKL